MPSHLNTRLRIEPLEPRKLLASARFAVIGDYGDPGVSEAAVADLVKSWNPDFILTTGDNNYVEEPLSFDSYDRAVGQYYHEFIGNYSGQYGAGSLSNRFFPSLGNHDWVDQLPIRNADAYVEFFDLPGAGLANSSGNERYYDFVLQGIHFFAIDAQLNLEPDGATFDSVQGQWLQSALAASTAEMQVVFFHDPPYSSGGGQGSSPHMRWPFAQWGADLVLSGHEHIYERLAVDGIFYFISGLGGGSYYPLAPSPLDESRFRYNADFGALLVTIAPEANTYEFYSIAGGGTLIERFVQYPQASVVGRNVFYNNSAFDDNLPQPNAEDYAAIASDKAALLPGQTATFANYTSYSKGINGVVVDVQGLPLDYVPARSDFTFRVGNNNEPAGWTAAPPLADFGWGVERGAGGSDRISLVWPDEAIKDQWLEVTLLAAEGNRLPADDVFYFGNAVGESGNTTADARVNTFDEGLARLNGRNQLNPAPIDFRFDYNRDSLVNAADQVIARLNATSSLTALRLIAPASLAALSAEQPESGRARRRYSKDGAR